MSGVRLAAFGLPCKAPAPSAEFGQSLHAMRESLKDLFRRRLAEEMASANEMSANELASKTRGEVGQTTVSRILRGVQDPSLAKVEAIAEALNLPAWYMFTEASAVETRIIRPPVITSPGNVKPIGRAYAPVFDAPQQPAKPLVTRRKKR